MKLSRNKMRLLVQSLGVEDPRMLFEFAIRKLTHPLFNVYYVFEFELADVYNLQVQRLPAGVALRLFQGEADIAYVATKLSAVGVPSGLVEQRMRRGDLAALILDDNEELAAYSWTTFSDAWIAEVGATLVLRSDEAVRFDSLILPRWRGRGLNYPLTIPISRYLLEKGYRRTLSWVSAMNTRSLKTQLRQGKRKIATIVSFPVLGIVRLRNLSSTVGVTLEKRSPA